MAQVWVGVMERMSVAVTGLDRETGWIDRRKVCCDQPQNLH